mmetsp:Transcript_14068/g.46643  ORF Transcript_14068/g.46643 Transcript_14068/m.46643 type:complete len:216 (-) Transcript_14068:3238-3885(-)
MNSNGTVGRVTIRESALAKTSAVKTDGRLKQAVTAAIIFFNGTETLSSLSDSLSLPSLSDKTKESTSCRAMRISEALKGAGVPRVDGRSSNSSPNSSRARAPHRRSRASEKTESSAATSAGSSIRTLSALIAPSNGTNTCVALPARLGSCLRAKDSAAVTKPARVCGFWTLSAVSSPAARWNSSLSRLASTNTKIARTANVSDPTGGSATVLSKD